MYSAKVLVSLFAFPSGRNETLAMENNRHNYSTVCVCGGVFWMGIGQKKYSGLNGNKFNLSLKYPKFIYECLFDF